MFSEKNIVVTIGNYGAVVALHEGNNMKNKIFLDDLTDAAQVELKTFFSKNKSASIYVLLDTIDQSYKKKVYPMVRRGDLSRIIKRDMASDGDKESMKNYILLNNKKISLSPKKQSASNRWECLFVSSSNSETINKWMTFLLDLENPLVGIYMLPIETYNVFKLLKKSIVSQSKIKNKHNDLYCIVMQNKVSGIRQVVFSDQGIVFTRVVNYNFGQSDFLEKYEQDIYSTFEYLKRLFPDLSINELDIVNILPAEALEALKNFNNAAEINFVNYTPFKAASELGYSNLLPQDSSFCDLLISKVFSKEKKLLKFTTPKVLILSRLFFGAKFSHYLNLLSIALICAVGLFTITTQNLIGETLATAEIEKYSAMQQLTKLKSSMVKGDKMIEDGEDIDIEEVIDFGKTEEMFGSVGINFFDYYAKLKFLKNFNLTLNKFSYSLQSFDVRMPSNPAYQINFGGELFNESGDIEDLFREFDNLNSEVKKNISKDSSSKDKLKSSELPRDIDFGKKYYSLPIDFAITHEK